MMRLKRAEQIDAAGVAPPRVHLSTSHQRDQPQTRARHCSASLTFKQNSAGFSERAGRHSQNPRCVRRLTIELRPRADAVAATLHCRLLCTKILLVMDRQCFRRLAFDALAH
jgi:hypothetical protein